MIKTLTHREEIDRIERQMVLVERLATYCHRELAEPMGPVARRMITRLWLEFEADLDRLQAELDGPLQRQLEVAR